MKSKDKICFKGEIVTKKDRSYNLDRQIWNRAIQRFPKAILYCESLKDVVCAVKFAVENCCQIRIRSGGHNYEGYSIGNNVVVIDVSNLKDIRINYEENYVEVQSGINNSQMYEYLGSRGYPFPGGTCLTVALSGYSLGGGWGLSTRLFGLGTDNLLEVEIVDYNGDVLIANENENSDLFWALRGAGGGNFGVVTSMKFRLPPKINNITVFKILYEKTNQSEQAYIMDIFQNLYQHLDRRANMRASFYNSKENGRGVYIFGFFYGRVEEAKDILKDLLKIPNAEPNFRYTSFLNAVREIGREYPSSEKFVSTGTFANRIYSKKELYDLAGLINERPLGSIFNAVTFYGLGGAVKDIKSNETAFYYRDANYIIGIQSVWEDSEYAKNSRVWINSKLDYLMKITEGFYVNFPYDLLVNYEHCYYGENAYRLSMVKRKFDPLDVFRFPQSIRLEYPINLALE